MVSGLILNKNKIMKWIEVKVAFNCTTKELATDLVSNIFYDLGDECQDIDDPKVPGHRLP